MKMWRGDPVEKQEVALSRGSHSDPWGAIPAAAVLMTGESWIKARSSRSYCAYTYI